MSDTRRVARDTKRAEGDMSEIAVAESRNWLVDLTKREHRGPTDTWTAARDRTARKIGVDPNYAKRLWQRWQDMKDVSGGAYRALRNAYEIECARMDAIADRYDRMTKDLLHEADQEDGARRLEGARLLVDGEVSKTAAPLPGARSR